MGYLQNTQEKFGPVHRLAPKQLFTVECIDIVSNKRHKSGYRVTEAKIIKWETGLALDQVATKPDHFIESIGEILSQYNLGIG